MLKVLVMLTFGSAALLLSACTEQQPGMKAWIEGNVPQESYQVAKKAEPKGDAFSRHLYEGYMELAERERAEYDWGDSGRFADKALAAAEGQIVNADGPYDRKIPADKIDEISTAHWKLNSLFDEGGRLKAPAETALAQVSFDCWIQEQEENHQPADIAVCRDLFYSSVGRVQAAMSLNDFVVYFSTDSAKLAEQQFETVKAAITAAKGTPFKVLVSGHTDATGPDARNVTLSEERAEAVKLLLLSAGLKAEQIEATHYGAAFPAVETGLGKPEPKNRRVEINFVR